VRADGGGFVVEAADRTYEADQVVVATGPFQVPFIPAISERLDPGIMQLHSSSYGSPEDLPHGTVLAVGGGNTGFQIAAELAESREVHLAVGTRQTPLPQRIAGRDLRYLEATGLMSKPVTSRLGQRMKERETLIGSSPGGPRKQGIRMRTRATGASGSTVTFADGASVRVDAVLWSTGFRLDQSFVELPVFDHSGAAAHQRGVSAVPGLYFLGLPWQHTRGSALLGWVKHDAQHIARAIDDFTRPA